MVFLAVLAGRRDLGAAAAARERSRTSRSRACRSSTPTPARHPRRSRSRSSSSGRGSARDAVRHRGDRARRVQRDRRSSRSHSTGIATSDAGGFEVRTKLDSIRGAAAAGRGPHAHVLRSRGDQPIAAGAHCPADQDLTDAVRHAREATSSGRSSVSNGVARVELAGCRAARGAHPGRSDAGRGARRRRARAARRCSSAATSR